MAKPTYSAHHAERDGYNDWSNFMDSPKTVAWQDKFEHHVYYGEPIVGLDGKPKSTGSVRLSTPSPSACR